MSCNFNSSWSLGIFFIVIVTIIWSFASFLTQYIYADLDFQSPFILTYISSSFFAIYLPAWQLWIRLGWAKDLPKYRRPKSFSEKKLEPRFNVVTQAVDSGGSDNEGDNGEVPFLPRSSSSQTLAEKSSPGSQESTFWRCLADFSKPLTANCSHEEILCLGLILCPLWLLGNVLYNYSLLWTSIASSTIISNTSGVFTLFFSWLCGIEDITCGKLIGLLFCFAGVVVVALQDQDGSSKHNLGGDAVAVLGALMYGLYTTVLKLKIPDDETVSMQLVLGYLGLVTALLMTPLLVVMIIFHWGSIDKFTGTIFGFVVLSAVFDDVIADYLWARAVLLTSPTVATVGLTLTIPLAIITDILTGNRMAVTGMSLGGAALVIVGFVLVNIGFEPIVRMCIGTGVENRERLPASETAAGYLGDSKDSNDA